MVSMNKDTDYMRYALRLAQRAKGRCAENPAVGCVLVRGGHIVGQGWTQAGGRPHAETQALLSAGEQARGAMAYVTLEPCAHTGKTPPCATALIKAGIAHVVVACMDDDDRVSGKGITMLREAGCCVEIGVLAKEAQAMNAGFFRRLRRGLPYITVKIATSADERITNPTHGQWVTSANAREHGHHLRRTHDAIVTGIGTVLADDPALTCRLSGLHDVSPIPVVLDRQLRIPLSSQLVQDGRLWLITHEGMRSTAKVKALENAGVRVFYGDGSFTHAMQILARQGINDALIEGGQTLTHTALQSGIANQLYWFQASHMVGEAGMAAWPAPYTLRDMLHRISFETHRLLHEELHIVALPTT